MKYFTLLFLFLKIDIVVFSQPFLIDWQKSLGGNRDDFAVAVGQTKDGGLIVVGGSDSKDGNVTGNHGDLDYWVVKLDAQGQLIWQRSYGGSHSDIAKCVQQTTDGGYIVAGASGSNDGDVTGHHGYNPYFSDYWVLKVDSLGNIQWENSYGGSGDDGANAIQQTSDGGYIVAGNSNSTDGDVTGNHGYYDYWVFKLDGSGNLQWQKSLGGSDFDDATSIQQTIDGGYIVGGGLISTDGDVTGHHIIYSGIGYDVWVVKLDTVGNIEWQKCYGGFNDDFANSIQQTADKGFIFAGYTESFGYLNHGFDDYYIVKTDSLGNRQWQRSLGGEGFDVAASIVQRTDGSYIVVGYSDSKEDLVKHNHGLYDYWILQLSTAGKILKSFSLGGSQNDDAASIAETSDGGAIVAGSSQSNDDQVSGHHGSTTEPDYWIVKLSPDAFAKIGNAETNVAAKKASLNDAVTISPNPTFSKFHICTSQPAQIFIYDVSGRWIESFNAYSTNFSFGSGYDNGMYIAKIIFLDGQTEEKKMIKTKGF